MSVATYSRIHAGLVEVLGMVILESRAIAAEAKIATALAILDAAIADDGAMLSPIALSGAVCEAVEALR